MRRCSKKQRLKLSDFATIEVGYHLDMEKVYENAAYTYPIYHNPLYGEGTDNFYYHIPIPEKYFTHEGDIVINISKLKDVILIDNSQSGLLISNRYLIVRCDLNKVYPGYICEMMLSDEGCERRRNAWRRHNLILPYQKEKTYGDIKFELPSLEVQREIYEIQREMIDSLYATDAERCVNRDEL